MKLRLLSVTAVLVSLFLAGCGKKDDASATTAAAPAAAAGPRVVEISAGDTMKFDVTSIEAKPGEEIKIIFTNVGSQPKEVMGHNWVLLKSDANIAGFATAAMAAKDTDYIPDALKDQIIAHIGLLGPRKSGEVTFKAPTTPGEYPYICSFPAHFQVGMKGVLTVK